jgi:hypothetical protein
VRQIVPLFYVFAEVLEARKLKVHPTVMRMKHPQILILALLATGQIAAQEAAPAPVQPVFSVLSESTVRQPDGSSITFRQVVPPLVVPQAQPSPTAPVPVLTPAQEAELSQMPVKELKVLSISASVQANGFTVLRWICGESQRLYAVSNVDFHSLEGLGNWETEQASYMLILSAGPAEQALTAAEAQAARSLPVNGIASVALVSGSAATSPADESALDAMEALLEYFDSHRQDLLRMQAERAARELAARNAPPPPPRHSIVHFWPLQPAQRAAILENTQRQQGAKQP